MEILVVQVFASLLLVLGGVLLLAYSVKQNDHEHADRMSLFPIEDDDPPAHDAVVTAAVAAPAAVDQPPSSTSTNPG